MGAGYTMYATMNNKSTDAITVHDNELYWALTRRKKRRFGRLFEHAKTKLYIPFMCFAIASADPWVLLIWSNLLFTPHVLPLKILNEQTRGDIFAAPWLLPSVDTVGDVLKLSESNINGTWGPIEAFTIDRLFSRLRVFGESERSSTSQMCSLLSCGFLGASAGADSVLLTQNSSV